MHRLLNGLFCVDAQGRGIFPREEAAAKLAELGYTNIVECGGILDWTGDVEK